PLRHGSVRLQLQKSISAPNHGDGSSEATAHVEGEKFSRVFDLASAGLFGEMLIRFEYLTHTGRADRMAIRNQTTARAHRNLEREIIGGVTVAEQTGRLALIGADFVHIFFRNEND